MKATSMNVFFRSPKMWKSQRGTIWAVWRMLNYFPGKFMKLIPHQIDSMGTGVIMQKDDSVRQHSRVFWLHGASQHPQPPKKRTTPLCSCFLTYISNAGRTHFTLLYAHLQSNKETTVWTCAFSLCMSPTLQLAVSKRNNNVASFCEECVLWQVMGFDCSLFNVWIFRINIFLPRIFLK